VASQPGAFAPDCINPPRSVLGCAADFPRSTALLGAAQIAPAGSPCREFNRRALSLGVRKRWPQPGVGAGGGAHVERRVAQGVWPRASARFQIKLGATVRAHERSECSELSARPRDRATQGSRHAVPTAEPKRHRLPPHPAAAVRYASQRTNCSTDGRSLLGLSRSAVPRLMKHSACSPSTNPNASRKARLSIARPLDKPLA
jgi:hypothetical protein